MANVDVTHVSLKNGDAGYFRDTEAIRKTSQSLTTAEKTQARTNIGAASTDVATTSSNGLMSSTDKSKLDNAASTDVATTSSNGLMSSTDKAKVDAIPSTNPVASLSYTVIRTF